MIITERITKKASGQIVSEKHDFQEIEVMKRDKDLLYAEVATTRRLTINMGNFNSAGIEVSVSIPSVFDEDAMDAAYEKAAEFCESRIGELKQKFEAISNG